MADIATNLARIIAAKADIKSAIEAKGVTVPDAAKIDTYDDYVAAIPTGGGEPVTHKNVNFYDYDGELLYSYTDVEFLALDAMPSNPMHSGLTAQGWNWTLADAKAYVTKYRYLEIGQMYVTDDGYTRIYITIGAEDVLAYTLWISALSATGTFSIDWGEGGGVESWSVTSTASASNSHTYSAAGSYVIRLKPPTGVTFALGYALNNSNLKYASIFGHIATNNATYILNARALNTIKKVEIGNGVTTLYAIGTYCETLSVSNTITTLQLGADIVVGRIRTLSAIIVPSSATALNYVTEANNARALSFSKNVTITGNMQYMLNVHAITLPESVTTLAASMFRYNTGTKVIVVHDSATFSSTYVFGNNSNAQIVVCKSALSNNYTFSDARNLVKIVLANTTTIPTGTFVNLFKIDEILVPEGVTTIGDTAFDYCSNVEKITLPSTLATIGTNSFRQPFCLKTLIVNATTPPTITSSSFANAIAGGFTIYVPQGYLSAYQNASGWTTWSSYMVEIS